MLFMLFMLFVLFVLVKLPLIASFTILLILSQETPGSNRNLKSITSITIYLFANNHLYYSQAVKGQINWNVPNNFLF